jgi:hypothetical protein
MHAGDAWDDGDSFAGTVSRFRICSRVILDVPLMIVDVKA